MRKIRQYPIPPSNRIALSLVEVCGLTNIGLASIRGAIACGQLKAHRLGRRVIICRADVDAFLKKLPRQSNV